MVDVDLHRFLLASAVLTPLLGKLGDQHGKERLLAISLVVFLLDCIAAAYAWDIWSLIAFRVVQTARDAARGDRDHVSAVALVTELERLFALLVRELPDDDLPLTATQRLALIELVDSSPQRLGELARRVGTTDPTASRAVALAPTTLGRERIGDRRRAVARTLARLPRADRDTLLHSLATANGTLGAADSGRGALHAAR